MTNRLIEKRNDLIVFSLDLLAIFCSIVCAYFIRFDFGLDGICRPRCFPKSRNSSRRAAFDLSGWESTAETFQLCGSYAVY